MGSRALYDEDFFAWANEQAGLLRAGRLSEADIEHIAEEIESMGRSEKRELISRTKVLLPHLLKWEFQPGPRGDSSRPRIEKQRGELDDHLADSPSLKAVIGEAAEAACRNAILGAARETGFAQSAFPATCRWSFEQIMDSTFYPEATH